jgi:hypothetical protein
LPPEDLMNIEINTDTNITTLDKTFGYPFTAPDGHATVLYSDEDSGKVYLYDPSFLNFRVPYIISEVPRPGITLLKSLGVNVGTKYKELWDYLAVSTFLRGFTFFKSSEIQYGISIFDFGFNQINFLEVEFEYYESHEEKSE